MHSGCKSPLRGLTEGLTLARKARPLVSRFSWAILQASCGRLTSSDAEGLSHCAQMGCVYTRVHAGCCGRGRMVQRRLSSWSWCCEAVQFWVRERIFLPPARQNDAVDSGSCALSARARWMYDARYALLYNHQRRLGTGA